MNAGMPIVFAGMWRPQKINRSLMLDFARALHDELLQILEELDSHRDPLDFSPDHRLQAVQSAIDQIKEKLKSHQFSDESEEIQFFKSVLPLFLSLFIYYREKFELESIQLIGTLQSRHEYIEVQSRRIEDFFRQHAEFFRYYRSGKTNLDRHYFLRSSSINQDNTELLGFVMDASFCTIYSVKIATILAFTRLEQDLHPVTKTVCNESENPRTNPNKLEWTDTKVGLIELIYSLKEQGAFNNGKADLKTIVQYFERIFSIHLGNSSSAFQEILSRKTGSTNYIDKLRDKLRQRIDEIV
jgi:hypothetical protein